MVSAEFIDRPAAAATTVAAPPEPVALSTNEGAGSGRLFVFIVDQNTLDPGSARRVATAAAPFLSRLSFSDRSALMVMPLGPAVSFTWAHDRVKEGLMRVAGSGRMSSGWEYGSLTEARDIANRNQFALRALGERSCGTASASGFGASPPPPSSSAPTAPAGGGTDRRAGGRRPERAATGVRAHRRHRPPREGRPVGVAAGAARAPRRCPAAST